MDARALTEAETRLGELRHDELQQFALGAVTLVASLVLTVTYEPLVLPLFLGAIVMWLLGIRSVWLRWDLVDRLADDRDAYVIPDVWAYAARDAGPGRRRAHAAVMRQWVRGSVDPGITEIAGELEQLARDLEDVDLELSPACALACRRLLTDPTVSPLLNGAPAEDIHDTISAIEAGFTAAGDTSEPRRASPPR